VSYVFEAERRALLALAAASQGLLTCTTGYFATLGSDGGASSRMSRTSFRGGIEAHAERLRSDWDQHRFAVLSEDVHAAIGESIEVPLRAIARLNDDPMLNATWDESIRQIYEYAKRVDVAIRDALVNGGVS
jgi:hypothetical protein